VTVRIPENEGLKRFKKLLKNRGAAPFMNIHRERKVDRLRGTKEEPCVKGTKEKIYISVPSLGDLRNKKMKGTPPKAGKGRGSKAAAKR